VQILVEQRCHGLGFDHLSRTEAGSLVKLGIVSTIGARSATVIVQVFDRDTPVEVKLSGLEPPSAST
jgi:hypothetical protein